MVSSLLEDDVADWAQALIDYRDEQTDGTYAHDLTRKNWHKEVPGFSGISIDENLITIESNFFRIQATASMGDVKITRSAIVHRRKNAKTGRWYCKILNWQAD